MGTTTVAQKTRKPRARLVFISILIAVASIITPLTATTPAYADTQSDIHDINYKYYAARYLRDCLAQLPGNQKGLIRQAALDQHVFLNPAQSNTKVSIGRYLEPDDGLAGCEETNLIQTAMASLGYGDDPGKLLTDIGYRKIDCTSPDNATYDAAVCTRADVRQVKQVVYERVNDRDTMNASIVDKLTQPPYARYVAYRGIFTQHCQLVEPPTGNGSAVTYKKVVQDSDGTYKAEDTKAEFVIREVTNNGNTARIDTGNVPAITRYDYNDQNTTCRDLLVAMGRLTDSVASYNNQHKDDPIDTAGGTNNGNLDPEDPTSSCTVGVGIGWLVCPVARTISAFIGTVFSMTKGFMEIQPLSTSTDTPIFKAWTTMRNIANAVFVVVFILVIYSQIAGGGGRR